MQTTDKISDGAETLAKELARVREAQKKFSEFSQAQVDKIFRAAALKANRERIPLAKLAAEETKMGVIEDKVIKNHFASEYIYNKYKNVKTCGLIESDASYGVKTFAEPVGVVAAVIPATNPTSTAIFKALLCLKTRNGCIFSPHPRAKRCTVAAVKAVYQAAVEAGAPEGIFGWIDTPTHEITSYLMKECDLILATGGANMVRAAYSSGKPAIGVGAGNTPAVFDESCDIRLAVNSVIHSKTFDNGLICASEQSVIVSDKIYGEVKAEFERRGCYFLKGEEIDNVRKTIIKDGAVNAETVGQSAKKIAELAKISLPDNVKILIGEVESTDSTEPFALEKLSPVLAMYCAKDFADAVEKAERLIEDGGLGHTSALYIDEEKNRDKIKLFSLKMNTCRILINTPSSQGGIGDLYNFKLAPSLTLGCGSRGGNSTSENVGVKHLLNIKTVAERRENMLWFRTPKKIYFKKGCLPVALEELKTVMNKKRAFVVTDNFLFESGYISKITDKLSEIGIMYSTFSDIVPDPTLKSAQKGAELMRSFKPDVIIAFGGGSAMDAAKIMWVLYEHPEADFMDMSTRFSDIRKRIYSFPKMGEKANFVAVPTSSGTGSEVTPFAVVSDDETGIKYPLADYELLPDMAIIDADLHMSAPQSLTASAGIDALSHALEAYVSVMASDFTDGLLLQAIKIIFKYLPLAYGDGCNAEAREKMANAATMAGMGFANAFLGVCHSMAHKLGSFHRLPHGIANALLLEEVIKFNSAEAPEKMATFSQYAYPHARKRYAEIADALCLGGNTEEDKVQNLISAITKLKEEIGVKKTIKDYGIAEKDFLYTLDKMSEQAFDDQCTGANPRFPLIGEIRSMYVNAYYGE